MAWPTPLESDALDRRPGLFAWAICFEAAVCFAGPVLMLLAGTWFVVPSALGMFLDPNDWVLRSLAMLLLGWSGIAGVARVLVILCVREQRDRYARLTLLGLACGTAVAVYVLWSATWAHEGPGSLMALVYLPLACTAHLAYLARRPLFR